MSGGPDDDGSRLEATIGTSQPVPDSADPDDVTVQEGADTELAHPAYVKRGQSIGRYVVVDKIGSGSMGVVYRAYDPDLDRRIALKLVEVRRKRGRGTSEIQSRLLREAQAIARVSHPNVIAVYDVGAVDLGVFVAMEYVDGQTLKQWMRARPRSWEEVVAVFIQAGRGLAAAHEAEIVHRDFKPDNVMIGRSPSDDDHVLSSSDLDRRVRVLDFGLARAAGAASTERPLDPEELGQVLEERGVPSIDASLTTEGMVVGTPAYMAPEQHLGATAGPASDQFSFCVALWEALYGERPFPGETHASVAFNMTRGNRRPPPSGRSVPRWLQQVAVKGLEVDVARRHPSMRALVAELERAPGGRRRRMLMGAAGLALVAGATWIARGTVGGDTEVCQSAAGRMSEVWDETRAQRIEEAFAASSLSFAPETWARARPLIDAWSRTWVTTRIEACEATRVHGEQSESLLDRRMACLDRGLDELSALLDLYEAPDRDVVIGAIDGARNLADLDRCNDVQALQEPEQPLDDPERIDEAQRLQASMTPLAARVRAGSFRELLPALDELAAAVAELDHPPVTERYYSLRAQVEQATGQTPQARTSWEKAFQAALLAEDEERSAWIAGRLTHVIGHTLALQRDGEFWADTALQLLRRFEDDGTVRASIQSARCGMALKLGQYDQGIELAEKVRAFWAEHGPEEPEMASVLGNLGELQRILGDYDEAIELHTESLQLVKTIYGDRHPETASAHRHLGLSLSFAGRHEEALRELETSLELFEASYGESNMEVAIALDSIGRALRRLNRLDEAEARHRKAYEIWRAEFGPDHVDVAISEMNIGYTLFAAGRAREALEQFEQARDTYRRAVGDDHPSHVYGSAAIGKAHLILSEPAKARMVLEQALTLDATEQVDPTLVAEVEFLLAQALDDDPDATAEDRARALLLARKARATYEPRAKHWQREIEELDAWLAQRQ